MSFLRNPLVHWAAQHTRGFFGFIIFIFYILKNLQNDDAFLWHILFVPIQRLEREKLTKCNLCHTLNVLLSTSIY